MDLAYDEIAKESLPDDGEGRDHSKDPPPATINEDLQAAVTALSPWASRIGGFFGNVVKQGGSVVREAQQEVTSLGQDASKSLAGLRDNLVSHTRNLSLVTGPAASGSNAEASSSRAAGSTSETTPTATEGDAEDSTVLTKIKGEAAKRLRDLQRAEDAADEALIKFGTGLRDFLRDAITIAPPTGGEASASGSNPTGSTVLFESKDAQGKRVIHTSRFDAQLHVIHTSPNSFSKDPSGDEFTAFTTSFDIDSKTTDIAADLNKYPELRATMEKLVPATVPYADFWKRYYFLRRGIEAAEARRRDLLKAASAEEDIAWDEDSDEEDSDEEDSEEEESEEEDSEEEDSDEEESDTDTESKKTKAASKAPAKAPAKAAGKAPAKAAGKAPAKAAGKAPAKAAGKAPAKPTGSAESSKTLHPPKSDKKTAAKKVASTTSVDGLLKPGTPRKSDEKSVADSEASYDIVGAKSGAPSQAPNSPQRVEEDSEEEDWE